MNKETRKQKEISFHDEVRSGKLKEEDFKKYQDFVARKRFYSIVKNSENFLQNFLIKNCHNKKVLDCGCGEGRISNFLAENGADVVGIDISPETIKVAKEKTANKNISFLVMDAEKMEFKDNFFDLIVCAGILHHLDIKKTYPELKRVLKMDGKIICNEPLIHNPIFQLYRRLTPHLRTEWEAEHILSKNDIELAEKYFGKIEKKFFYLFSLMAVPFSNKPRLFNTILATLTSIDSVVLKLPFIKWWAWQIIFILSQPKK